MTAFELINQQFNPKEEKYILSKKIIKLIKSDQRKIRNKKSSKISQ